MAIPIKPDELRTQGLGESVIYELPWDIWDQDLAKTQRDTKLTTQAMKGLPPAVTLLPDDRMKRLARILVRTAGRGDYQITRTVVTKTQPPESRKRSFRVLVE